MYVVVPPGPSAPGTNAWARGVRQPSIAESVDLCLRLCDLASLPLPNMALGGESLRALLYQPVDDAGAGPVAKVKDTDGFEQETDQVRLHDGRRTYYAVSQWPRRPSCVHNHNCEDGHGNPYEHTPDQAVMVRPHMPIHLYTTPGQEKP